MSGEEIGFFLCMYVSGMLTPLVISLLLNPSATELDETFKTKKWLFKLAKKKRSVLWVIPLWFLLWPVSILAEYVYVCYVDWIKPE